MKLQKSLLLIGTTIIAFAGMTSWAGDIYKNNSVANALNNTGSWVGGVIPVATDTAVWEKTVTSVTSCTNNPGANHSWLGNSEE